MAQIGLAVSPSTLLRQVRRAPTTPSPVPRVLGVDDFALRKGRTYGTILVDLEQHRAIDLLPDRTAATLARWLRAHPGVEVISRDRATEYARGASLGAPRALQVADRFHLVKNLREALERLVDRNRSRLRGITLPSPRAEHCRLPVAALRRPARRSPAEASVRELRRTARQARFAQVRALAATGQSVVSIAQQLQLSRGTVYRYLRHDSDPTASQWRTQPSILDPYLPMLYRRWQEGCENAAQLLRELRAAGYAGSRKMVASWVAQRRQVPAKTGPRKYRHPPITAAVEQQAGPAAPQGVAPKPAPPLVGPAQLLLIREPQSPARAEQAVLKQIQAASTDLAAGYALVQEFLTMVDEHQGVQLDSWLAKIQASGLVDLQSFAHGVEKDKGAVAAGLSETWSNGQVEGQVNRLKLKKREMYGRASFDLLRRRVLNAVR